MCTITFVFLGVLLGYSLVSSLLECSIVCNSFRRQTFECDRLEDLGRSFLRADYSLHCQNAQHTSYMVYSGVMILVRRRNPCATVHVLGGQFRHVPSPEAVTMAMNFVVFSFFVRAGIGLVTDW